MSFLFKNRSVKPGAEKSQTADPLPGFLKTEPTFSMDYPVHEKESLDQQQNHSSYPQPTFTPHHPQGMHQNHLDDRQGPVTLSLSHSGIISILFALFLLSVLFFLAGFLSGMLITEHANQAQYGTVVKNTQTPSIDSGDENV